MAKIDEFRIDDLTRRLERLLKVWATICFEPIEEIPEERLADVRAEARGGCRRGKTFYWGIQMHRY